MPRLPPDRPASSPTAVRRRVGFRRAVDVYAGLVVVAGAAVLFASVAGTPVDGLAQLAGPRPDLFLIFAGLLLVTELRPIPWLTRGGARVTASWTFACSLLLLAPAGGALLAMAGATLVGELIARKAPIRVLFNTAQVTLSMASGAATLVLLAPERLLLDPQAPLGTYLVVAAFAGLVVFLVNGVLTCTALALDTGVPVGPALRAGVAVNVATDGLLLALAPVFVIIAQRSLALLPLLLVTAVAVYRNATIAEAQRHQATHDVLTNLPNRRLFTEEVELARTEAERSGDALGIVLLDLDGFKAINDQLGHHAGDMLLQQVAQRLDRSGGPAELVARLGGDEFALLLTGLPAEDAEAAAGVAANGLLDQLARPCMVQGFPVAISGSFGVALCPDHGADVDVLLQRADVAMYAAKHSGRGVVVYNDDRDRDGHGRIALLAELSGALERFELVLHYQPKVDLRTGEVRGVEALLRWDHPRLGFVPPDQFMPLAEHTELMEPLTEYVLRAALEQCAAWARMGLSVPVAVNGSARNVRDLRFPETVRRLLDETGVPADHLEIEITENTVMTDPVRTTAVLAALQTTGVSVSIDDFGTGFSSLSSLRDLPVDCIKIDRSFVRDMSEGEGDAVIMRSIIEMARNLGLMTVAEGVEDADAAARLRDLGCDAGQGYHWVRPSSARGLTPWLRRRAAATAPPRLETTLPEAVRTL